MKKTLSLILALLMMLSCFGAFAEEDSTGESAETTTETTETTDESAGDSAGAAVDPLAAEKEAALNEPCEFFVIPADETTGQVQLSYIATTTILEVDGLKFKDLNKNGTLDVYEDWRQPVEARVEDIYSQMTVEEKAGLLFCTNTSLSNAVDMIQKWHQTCQLFNLNGTPVVITNNLNNLQAAAEAERLGVPMVFTSDREYNSFGGYIDKSHEAFGNANDPELAYKLASYYGKAMDAIGIHVTFEPYANEIGAQYGENPELIASIISAEIKGLQENGLSSCTKHWIGRGGDSSFSGARSVAQNFDNWMVGWEAAINAGCDWIMTNCGDTGITNSVDVKFDPVTMGYLRDTLGFDGVIVTDWWPIGGGPQSTGDGRLTGITPDGHDLSTKDIYWLYNRILELGTDILGSGGMQDSHENWTNMLMTNYPTAMIQGINEGTIKEENVKRAATNVLTYKFEKGLFEDPYNDIEYAVEVCASVEWAATRHTPTSNEDLRAARNPEEVALTEELMAKSAVLVKNDDNLLPLSQGIKVYIDGSGAAAKAAYKTYIAAYATVVETMEEADVVIGDYGSVNDACELFIEDAQAAGKKIVLTLNNTDPTQYAIENADALMYLPYNHNADHGSTEAGFVNTTAPWVYADLMFGVAQPGGIITKELSRSSADDSVQWKDLAGDQGADPYVRLMIQATMEDAEQHASPNNWGDPLVQYHYGMTYGQQPEWKYSCLILPQALTQVEGEDSSGNKTISTVVATQAKAGEAFTVYCLLRNNGSDGITTVQAYANDVLVAEKIYTVCGGSWRVVQIDMTLEAGEYTINVGGQTGTLTVVE